MGLFGFLGKQADKATKRAVRAAGRATVGRAKRAYKKQVQKATRQAIGTSPRRKTSKRTTQRKGRR